MKVNRGPTSGTVGTKDALRGVPFLPGDVTDSNYAEKAIAFMRVSGRANGDHPVVGLEDDDMGPFLAWSAYLSRMKATLFARRAAASFHRQQRKLTVPAVWPWLFCMDADDLREQVPAMVNAERDERRRAADRLDMDPQQRSRITLRVQDMRGAGRRLRKDWRSTPEPIPELRPWRRGDPASAPLSSEALSSFGITPKHDKDEAA